MIKIDENALICDLAEIYNIYDYRQLPPTRVAVFSVGLRDDSRIKMKLSGHKVSIDTLLLAGISDKLETLIWFKTKDGQKGKNRPVQLVDLLNGVDKQSQNKDIVIFNSGEEFIKQRNKIIAKRR